MFIAQLFIQPQLPKINTCKCDVKWKSRSEMAVQLVGILFVTKLQNTRNKNIGPSSGHESNSGNENGVRRTLFTLMLRLAFGINFKKIKRRLRNA